MTHQVPKTDVNLESQLVSDDQDGMRLDRWIRRQFPGATQAQIQKWARTGQIRVNGKRCEASTRLEIGQQVRLPPGLQKDTAYREEPKRTLSEKRPLRDPSLLTKLVLYEDAEVVVINKPSGLAVQGGTGLKENLDDSLMVFSVDGVTRPKLVHRLDRETSGVLLIARTAYAAAKLAAAFRAHETKKIYWGVTLGVPRPLQGRINDPIIKVGQKVRIASADDEESKSAETLYEVVENLHKKLAFVALWPLTGRTHQLRVHMAHKGTPLLGDPLYKRQETIDNILDLSGMSIGKGLHLHARRLVIPHPRRGIIDVTAPLSEEMQKTWKSLGFSTKIGDVFENMD
ncbi:MAG: RluA family pseudouridine synthase [Proteobacteria bacterium]|nr:RluA family pseudouridine synthase [Pseudomonadota bacterium]